MQTNKPDDTTGDSVTLARVHTFLAALLSFLGFGVLPTATIANMLDELTGWLDMAKAIRRDPQGATARIWWDAFKVAWGQFGPIDAGTVADEAANEFGKRFLPVNDEDRDTLNTTDFDAMREELDRLTQIAAELRSERDALLKTNTHHASEIETLRTQEREFFGAICMAMGLPNNGGGYDIVTICRDNARDARNHDDAQSSHETYVKRMREALDCHGGKDTVEHAKLLRAKLTSAIVPLPKPERVEPGQRWAMTILCDWPHADGKGGTFFKPNGERFDIWPRDINDSALQYLGTEAK